MLRHCVRAARSTRPSKLILAAILLLAGCTSAVPIAPTPSSATSSTSQPATSATETARPGGNLRALGTADVSTLDFTKTLETYSRIFAVQMYDTLVMITPANSPADLKPGLAESWSISPDGLTYTFQLRKDVKFHSGRALTAEDVVYSVNRLTDPKTASPFRTLLPADMEATAPSTSSAVLKLKAPFAPLLSALTDTATSIVDRDAAEADGGLDKHDGGTGPFIFGERVLDDHLTLRRNPDFWQPGKPYLDSITFTFNTDTNARVAALRSGTVDFLFTPDPTRLTEMKSDPNLQVQGQLAANAGYMGMNTQKAPFSDVKVRQAIMYALGREDIRKLANGDIGEVLLGGFLSPRRYGALKSPVYGPNPDIEKAKTLLQEAGLASGFSAKTFILQTSPQSANATQVIQQQLKPLGIDIEIQKYDVPSFLSLLNQGQFDTFEVSLATTLDPDQRLTPTFGTGGASNWPKWSDAEYDNLLNQARVATDVAAREKLYQEAETILATRGPAAFIFDQQDVAVTSKKVQGFVMSTLVDNYRGISDIWLGQ